MKSPSLVVSFLVLLVSVAVHAQGNNSPYVQALNHLSDKCVIIAYTAALEAERTGAITQESEKISPCIGAANAQAAGVYKSYVAKEKSKQIKDDMKAVYVAWLVYFPESISFAQQHHDGSVDDSIAANAYKRAVSTLQVDKLTQ